MTSPLKVGDPAPAFHLPRDGGGELTLAGFAGRKLVLYFYPKDDTSGCTREAIDFHQLGTSFAAADADVVGISPDSPASHDAFKAKHKLDLALASDEEKSTCEAYGVWTQKSMYGRKYMGVERTTFLLGRDGRIAAIWPNVKVPGHAAVVLAAVQAIP